MITHWTKLTMSHDIRLSSNHDLTKLFHCVVSQPWDNIEFMSKLAMTLTYEWDHKVIIYPIDWVIINGKW